MKHFITKLLLFLLLAMTGTAMAQNNQKKERTWEKLPMENTAWIHLFCSSYDDSTYYQVGIKGDTIINSVSYYKMYDCPHIGFPIEGRCFGAIRQDDEGKCYFVSFDPMGVVLGAEAGAFVIFTGLELNTEYVVYDFALSVCEAFPYDGDQLSWGIYYEVFQIDEILINGSNRKVFWFDDGCELEPHYYEPKWIEGIGSNHGLLYSLQKEPTLMGVEYRLVEILQDGEILYTAPEFVGVNYTGVPESASSNEEVRLYPHPITESGTLDFGQLNAEKLTITTVDGRIVRKENVKGLSSYTIEKGCLGAGVYFYMLSGNNTKNVIGKMIIQ